MYLFANATCDDFLEHNKQKENIYEMNVLSKKTKYFQNIYLKNGKFQFFSIYIYNLIALKIESNDFPN